MFKRLRKYQLKLNLVKCIFRVKSGKLLRFVVSTNGREVDPDKIKVIQAILAPKTKRKFKAF
jgi:hypothetical protein